MDVVLAILGCVGFLILLLLYNEILEWIPKIFSKSNLILNSWEKQKFLEKKFKPKNKKYNCQKIVKIEITIPLYKSGTWKVLGYTKEDWDKKLTEDVGGTGGFLGLFPDPQPKPILISKISDKELDKLI